jgi:small subunit ribosomal protein S15
MLYFAVERRETIILEDCVDRERKSALIEQYRTSEQDTGSSDVQIALLTERIKELTGHLRGHRHDQSTRRGLLRLVGQRRRLLRYVYQEDRAKYQHLIQSLGLRG